jgi:hypothetical protein
MVRKRLHLPICICFLLALLAGMVQTQAFISGDVPIAITPTGYLKLSLGKNKKPALFIYMNQEALLIADNPEALAQSDSNAVKGKLIKIPIQPTVPQNTRTWAYPTQYIELPFPAKECRGLKVAARIDPDFNTMILTDWNNQDLPDNVCFSYMDLPQGTVMLQGAMRLTFQVSQMKKGAEVLTYAGSITATAGPTLAEAPTITIPRPEDLKLNLTAKPTPEAASKDVALDASVTYGDTRITSITKEGKNIPIVVEIVDARKQIVASTSKELGGFGFG